MAQDFATTGRLYNDNLTPVPFPAYRCPSTARDTSRKAHTHLCKITVDHADDHECICGKGWPKADDLAGRAAA